MTDEPTMVPETKAFSGPYVLHKASTKLFRHQSFDAAEQEARRLVAETGEPFRILQERGITRMRALVSDEAMTWGAKAGADIDPGTSGKPFDQFIAEQRGLTPAEIMRRSTT